MPRTLATRLDSLPKRQAAFIQPTECALVSRLPEGSDWTYEIKLDGYRAIGVRASREAILYSRNGKNFNKRYPHIAEALNGLPCDTVVDGEVVALDDSRERKFAILFAATILAARRLADLDPNRPNMAKGFFVDRAIEDAAFILERIDSRWPTIVNSFSAKEP